VTETLIWYQSNPGSNLTGPTFKSGFKVKNTDTAKTPGFGP